MARKGEQTEALALLQPATEELRTYDFDKFALAITELEDRGKALGWRTSKLPEKGTAKSAEKAQEIVRDARLAKRDIPETWNVLKKIQSLAKVMVGRRQIAERLFQDAIEKAQEHHFMYVDAENKRVAAEQEKKRLAAEAVAQEERRQELAKLEQLRLEAEESSPDLSEREQRFVKALFRGRTPFDASITAGYADARRAEKRAEHPKIRAALAAMVQVEKAKRRAEAVKEAPLDLALPADRLAPEKPAGRSTRSAEVTDIDALRDAVIRGNLGIPWDVLTVDQVRLNALARDLGPLIDRWPGVRLKVKRSLV